MERSRWSRTENLNIWKDQFDNVKNMTSENPRDYETGDGFKIFDITQLSSFLEGKGIRLLVVLEGKGIRLLIVLEGRGTSLLIVLDGRE